MAERLVAIRFGIVCDQVRREDNGKLLLVGVYGHNISVPSLPTNIMLTLVLGIVAQKRVTDHPVEVQTEFNGRQIHGGRGTVSVTESGTDLLVVPNILVPAATEGELTFKAKLGNDRWKVISTMPLQERTA